MIRYIFNEHNDVIYRRGIPQTPEGLAEGIIEKSYKMIRRPLKNEPFLALILLPRPLFLMGIIFALSLYAGLQSDFGFFLMGDTLVSADDILMTLDEDIL